MIKYKSNLVNAFCVDMEDWFHISGSHNFTDPRRWEVSPESVVKDTEKLLEIFAKYDVKVTFLVLGWIARKYPSLIKRISDLGHEIGSHGFYHRLVYKMTPEEFELDVAISIKLLKDITGKEIRIFRAPSFSITKDCFWTFPILSKLGIKTDISVVPAKRNQGGIEDFPRDPFILENENGEIQIIPVTVMDILGKPVQFSGGGFLRFFPEFLLNQGFNQNHKHERQVMSFIHPREINPYHPRVKSSLVKYLRLYMGLTTVDRKLNFLFRNYKFSSISKTYNNHSFPRFKMGVDNKLESITSESKIL